MASWLKWLGFAKDAKPAMQKKENIMQLAYSFVGGQTVVWLNNSRGDFIDAGYMADNIVFALSKWKANKIKNCPFVLYRVKSKRKYAKYKALMTNPTNESFQKAMQLKSQAMEIVEDHALLTLLDQPNQGMTGAEFKEAEITYRDMVGSSYIRIHKGLGSGKVTELELIPSQEVMIRVGADGYPAFLSLTRNADINIPYDEIIQTRHFNPKFSWQGEHLYGMSILESASKLLVKHRESIDAEAEAFKNRGARELIFPQDSNFADYDDTTIKRVNQQLNDKLTEGGNARVVANAIPLGSIKIGMSPVDLNILESNIALKKDFCAMYGISPLIFDWSNNSTYNNLLEARKMSLIDGVIPYQEDLKDSLNKKLVPLFGSDLVLDWDYQAYPEMQSDLQEQTDRLAKSFWLTVDEKRVEQDYPALNTPNSQMPLVPSNLTNLEDLGMDSPTLNLPNADAGL